ncbi:MAG: M67 family metallopeptidase [Myxococcales bacterium]|nr:M67 family metallopeptidase [Myxococcales bacterium]
MSEPALPADLSEVLAHLAAAYPNEGCGVILREPSGNFTVRPLQNAYDRYRAADPEHFPRTSRTAYFFDPKEWLRVSKDADARGATVCSVFHSHCDVGAYFSAEDRAMAAPDDQPLMPGISYLVVAINHGIPSDAKVFWWRDGDFRVRGVPVPL